MRTRKNIIQVRLNDIEYRKIVKAASIKQINKSELIRDLVNKHLPDVLLLDVQE